MGLQGEHCLQMLHEVAGVIPKEVVVMNDQEVVMELEENFYNGGFKSNSWVVPLGGQSISVDSLVAKKDLIANIVRE